MYIGYGAIVSRVVAKNGKLLNTYIVKRLAVLVSLFSFTGNGYIKTLSKEKENTWNK